MAYKCTEKQTKICVTQFIAIFALLHQSETKSAMSQKYPVVTVEVILCCLKKNKKLKT